MKVDLVMWTKNGEATLAKALAQIAKVIPESAVNHRILIDDHSVDCSRITARRFGWDVYLNSGSGISDGANTALKLVETEFFCSFEQDVVIAEDWWSKIPQYMRDSHVGCAQGIRVHTHPLLKLIDEETQRKTTLVSFDNNIFRTKAVLSLGV